MLCGKEARLDNMNINREVSRRGGVFAKLSFYSQGNGGTQVIDKIVGAVNNKNVGLAMLQRILERFSITQKDIEDIVTRSIVEQRSIPDKKIIWSKY